MLTIEQWRERVAFDPESGRAWYLKSGNEVRAVSGGYRLVGVTVDGKSQSAHVHRIGWQLVNGPIPMGIQIDHINHNRLDNRLCNLRLASRSQNMANTRLRTINTSGFKGVSWHKASGKWQAQFEFRGPGIRKGYALGLYTSREEAARAYDRAAVAQWGEFAETNLSLGNYEKYQWEKHERDQERSYA